MYFILKHALQVHLWKYVAKHAYVIYNLFACFFQPLLSAEELHQTRSVVAEFGKAGGLGERLQQKLLERAKTHENWVSLSEISVSYLMCILLFLDWSLLQLAEWWDSVAYLARRAPLVINASTCVSYPHQECWDRDAFVR